MADEKKSVKGGGCGIKMGCVLGVEGVSFEMLPEGCGVVMVACHDSRDDRAIAYGEVWDLSLPHEKDILEKNLVGAKMQHGDQAFLVKKENGVIIREKGKLSKAKPKALSAVPAWKQDRWQNFGRVNEVAARR